MEIQVGKQSLAFAEAPYIISSASIVGKKESEGPLGNRFDVVGEDDKFGQNTWEEAESTLQKEAFTLFRKKRDAELDAKIAALDRHIEQVKQNLADELAKCELEVEEKNNNLYERILDEAERSHVKDEVVQAIGK